MIAETLVLHVSDFIEWLDASGPQAVARRTLPAQNLDKTAGTALWRREPEGLCLLVAGEAEPADLTPPDEALYPIAGEVRDRAGIFLPRHFAFDAGGREGHRLRLFRSPLGTRFGRAGGLYGRTLREDGTPVPWALLTLHVVPPLAEPLDFIAQSDARGEFRLSLERLPSLTKDAPAQTYPATLALRAAADGTDPDTLPAAQVRGTGSGNAAFKTELTVDIAPGRIATLASPGRDALVLRIS